jgi:predicted regulator of Ras-like GTPase activity (Roadblock/LC7/MglB family)
MCASVLESATGLGSTMGDRKANKIIAELEMQTIIITECDEKTFLVFDLNNKSNFITILENMEEYIRKIIFLY